MYLSFEFLGIRKVVVNFNKLKEDAPFLLNGVVFGHVCLKVGGEKMEGGKMAGHVDTKKLKECVDVFTVCLAVNKETFDQHRALLTVLDYEGVLG